MPTDVADLRREYRKRALDPDQMAADPIAQFEAWLEEAVQAEVNDPTAMTLATAAPDGQPSARVVLLKGVDARGLAFYTNYRSRKARELEANARAALVFYWAELERQVRLEGPVERTTGEEADAYFARRPRASQLGAWASEQSTPVPDREALEAQLAAARERFEGREVPRPPHWGGYRLAPEAVEFWQGRPGRLHDRIRYYRTSAENWQAERLAP